MTGGDPARHLFPQIWLIVFGVIVFGAYVAIDQDYLSRMLEADRSRISVLILAIFAGASAHAAWHILGASRRIEATRAFDAAADIGPGGPPPEPGPRGLLLEVQADQLRSPVDIGWYLVDILIRLGLVGTIVGFILILGALADGADVNPENIQSLLISMSGGMGVALYTTLTGLVAATFLGVQYMILGRCVEHLIGALIRAGAE